MRDVISILGTVVVFLIVAAVDCQGDYRVIGSDEGIEVLVGQEVILPCHLESPVDVTNLTVEWSLGTTLVHVYRNRKDDLTLQHNDFKGRTSLFHEEMRNGNLSIQISRVNKGDGGDYTCFIPKLKSSTRRAHVSLIVKDKDEPKPIVDSTPCVGVHVGVELGMLSVQFNIFLYMAVN
ncbi:myelin-oligodendrocyte glycoprotein-like [Thunnus albacares]|uniref:myelin-oligodendrocyte glycoprotein-like n=1 Tax=Thunnus albacares TaxID=8236 RepID=UPI001CF6D140|nr:myelin-oligodendrocyte glycoprotein-like [Thunnus albacares]XP_044198267.1 myelin-oligodendrocyte glycoprotein-like [Thunnus albacares]